MTDKPCYFIITGKFFIFDSALFYPVTHFTARNVEVIGNIIFVDIIFTNEFFNILK